VTGDSGMVTPPTFFSEEHSRELTELNLDVLVS
jgi:hypothetical protein